MDGRTVKVEIIVFVGVGRVLVRVDEGGVLNNGVPVRPFLLKVVKVHGVFKIIFKLMRPNQTLTLMPYLLDLSSIL